MQHFRPRCVSEIMESEEQIVKRAIHADKEAFNQLVSQYYRSIYLLAYQKVGNYDEAEDMAQDIFVKAYKGLGSLKDPAKFGSWIYQITHRHIIDWYRKNRRSQKLSLQSLEEVGFEIPQNKKKEEIDKETLKKVMQTLSELPQAYRLVVTLRFLEGLSSKEIALRLDEPAGTVRCRLSRAAAILRRKLTSKPRGCKK